jgi:hypothetical protein
MFPNLADRRRDIVPRRINYVAHPRFTRLEKLEARRRDFSAVIFADYTLVDH